MKTLYEWNALSVEERALYLWEHGIFLMMRRGEVTKVLYALHEYYAEVEFDPRTIRIVRMRSFKSKAQALEPYLNEISL